MRLKVPCCCRGRTLRLSFLSPSSSVSAWLHCASIRVFCLSPVPTSTPQVKKIAAEFEVEDGPNDEGEMFERPAKPSDR